MRKLWLIGLAASAAITPMAAAQTIPDGEFAGPGAVADLRLPAAAAAPALAAAAHETARAPVREVVRELRHVPVAPHRWQGGPRPDLRMRGPHAGGNVHFQRIRRGGIVPHFWMGPQFVVRNWGGYGFPAPVGGHRWIRYYDDALLIDGHGRVHDGRYGYDWDRYGDEWDDRDGIPVYAGDGDYDHDYEGEDHDYEWAERRGSGHGHAGRHHGPPPHPMPPHPMPPHGYGYWGGCGCGPVVVTETVTTTAPVVETRTYYEYVTEEVAPRRQYRRPLRRAAPKKAPPPPRPGERG